MAELNSELSSGLDINRLPPELLTRIFQFLPFSDLNNALLVCRLTKNKNKILWHMSFAIRRWNELGEQPILWSKLSVAPNLHFPHLHQTLIYTNPTFTPDPNLHKPRFTPDPYLHNPDLHKPIFGHTFQ